MKSSVKPVIFPWMDKQLSFLGKGSKHIPSRIMGPLQHHGTDQVLSQYLPQCRLDSLGLERNALKTEDLKCHLAVELVWGSTPQVRGFSRGSNSKSGKDMLFLECCILKNTPISGDEFVLNFWVSFKGGVPFFRQRRCESTTRLIM